MDKNIENIKKCIENESQINIKDNIFSDMSSETIMFYSNQNIRYKRLDMF